MDQKDEIFLLAKLHLAEAIATHFIAALSVIYGNATKQPPEELIDTLSHNLRETIRTRFRVLPGDLDRTDPMKVQAEMLRQLEPAVAQMRHALERFLGRPQA